MAHVGKDFKDNLIPAMAILMGAHPDLTYDEHLRVIQKVIDNMLDPIYERAILEEQVFKDPEYVQQADALIQLKEQKIAEVKSSK